MSSEELKEIVDIIIPLWDDLLENEKHEIVEVISDGDKQLAIKLIKLIEKRLKKELKNGE